jgi:hypothetical protein
VTTTAVLQVASSPAQNIPEEIAGGEFSVAEVRLPRDVRLRGLTQRGHAVAQQWIVHVHTCASLTHRCALRCSQVFGDAIIKQLSSEKWDQREQALQKIDERLRQEANVAAEMSDRLPLFNACCCIVRTAMNDKVAPVYFEACKLLEYMLSDYGKDLPADEVRAGISPLMTSMLGRTGESNQRVLECTCALFLSLARLENVGLDFVAGYITQPVKTMRKLRLVWGRLDLLRRAIVAFGLKRSAGFSAETVMPMVVPALDVADEKVRKMAVRVVTDVYKIGGKEAIAKHTENCKPALQNLLQRRFDKADGKESAPTKRSAGSLAPIKGSSLPPLSLRMDGVAIKGGPSPGLPGLAAGQAHPFGGAPLAMSTLPPPPAASDFLDDEESLMNSILQDGP